MERQTELSIDMGFTALLLAAIAGIAFVLLLAGRYYLGIGVDGLAAPVIGVTESNAYYLSSSSDPVPVANVWRLVLEINSQDMATGNGNFAHFTIQVPDTALPGAWVTQSTDTSDLTDYLAEQAYVYFSVDSVSGFYSLDVLIAA